ncbi:MAG: response regulator [Planctomycetaceae bacterium]
MLVLSRKEQESIVFPNLGIRVQVTRVRGKAVSIGVEAPDEVRVLRGELHQSDEASPAQVIQQQQANAPKSASSREREHELRNRINTLTLALHLLHKKASKDSGMVDETLLAGAIDELALIEETLHDKSKAPDIDDVSKMASLPLALLVDDNANETSLLAGYLRTFGFRVATALDGRAALRFMESNTRLPDIVLLDMNMPGLNGRGTIDAIRRNPKTHALRVFAVSGEDQETSNVPIGSGGVDRWFQKPISPDKLVHEMSREIQTISA